MSPMLEQLLQPASVFMAAALLLGGVFDRFDQTALRNGLVGVTCGIAAALLIAVAPGDGGLAPDGREPLILVGAFFGGLTGAVAVIALPLATVLFQGGTNVVSGMVAIVLLAASGYIAHLVRIKAGMPLQRTSVLWLALLSPVAYAGGMLPDLASTPLGTLPELGSLAFWLPFGTIILGFAVINELGRGDAKRARRAAVRFRELTDTVSLPLFKGQLDQHFRMHQRYGHEYSYILASIDNAPALRKLLGDARWEFIRAAVGTNLRRAVREPDVAAAIDFDRFAVILPHASLPFAIPVAQRIQAAIEAALDGASGAHRITISVGVAEVDGTHNPDEIAAAAEAELFLANMRQPTSAIGPLLECAPLDMTIHSFPGAILPSSPEQSRRAKPSKVSPGDRRTPPALVLVPMGSLDDEDDELAPGGTRYAT